MSDKRLRPAGRRAWRWMAALAALGSLAATDDRGSAPSVDLDARRQRVLAMSADRYEHVVHNRDRLAEMPALQQEKLRRLEEDLERAPDAERLRRVMLRYHEWLRALTLAQRTDVVDLPPEERLARIKVIRAKQRARLQAETTDGKPLSWADKAVILSWFDKYAQKHQDHLLADLTPEKRQQIEQLDPGKRHWPLFLLVQRGRSGRPIVALLPTPTAAEFDPLVAKLSPAAQESMRQRGSLGQQWILLTQWAQAAIRGRMVESGTGRAATAIAVDELQRFFETVLPPQKREELLNLPPEETQREVRRLFFQRPGHWESSQFSDPPPKPRPEDADGQQSNGTDDNKAKPGRSFDRLRSRLKEAGAGNRPGDASE